jgi:hypothetical protein
VRVNLINDSMMGHPIHIHGHFFELVTGHGDHGPRKHTVIVQPGGKVTWDFTADAVGDWAFHCHLLYHMHAGMMRIVSVRPKGGQHDAARCSPRRIVRHGPHSTRVRAGSFDAQHAGDVDADGTATGCKAQAQGEKTGTPSTSACGAPGEARASQACPATGSIRVMICRAWITPTCRACPKTLKDHG